MSRKRERRIAQLNEDYEEAVVQQSLTKSLEIKENEELFVIDRQGSEKRKKKVAKELLPKATKSYISPTEQKIIQKYISKGFPSQVKKSYGADIVEVKSSSSKRSQKSVSKNTVSDLWEESSMEKSVVVQEDPIKQPKKKLRVAFPGQSYHPTPEDHQNILAEAVAIEMKLKEAISSNSKLSSSDHDKSALIPAEYSVNNFYVQNQTTQDISNLLLMNNNDDDDEEEDSSDNDSDDDSNNQEEEEEGKPKKKKKVPEKLTKAQINRKKALRLARYEQGKIKAQEQVNKSINQLPKVLKELAKQEEVKKFQETVKQSKLRKKLREEQSKKAITLSERKKLQRLRPTSTQSEVSESSASLEEGTAAMEEEEELRPHEISSVPLSDELHSSLRKVTPKGVAVKDYMFDMIENGFMNAKRKKGFAIKDHPYLPKKVKWIPKYKY